MPGARPTLPHCNALRTRAVSSSFHSFHLGVSGCRTNGCLSSAKSSASHPSRAILRRLWPRRCCARCWQTPRSSPRRRSWSGRAPHCDITKFATRFRCRECAKPRNTGRAGTSATPSGNDKGKGKGKGGTPPDHLPAQEGRGHQRGRRADEGHRKDDGPVVAQ